jgi:hypothetical protein
MHKESPELAIAVSKLASLLQYSAKKGPREGSKIPTNNSPSLWQCIVRAPRSTHILYI